MVVPRGPVGACIGIASSNNTGAAASIGIASSNNTGVAGGLAAFRVSALTTLVLALLKPCFIAFHARCILVYNVIYHRDLRVALGL